MSHPDYETNLKDALKWIAHYENKLPEGMSIKISNSENLIKSLLFFSYQAPMICPKPSYAMPVFLHQNNETFRKEIKKMHQIIEQVAMNTNCFCKNMLNFNQDKLKYG